MSRSAAEPNRLASLLPPHHARLLMRLSNDKFSQRAGGCSGPKPKLQLSFSGRCLKFASTLFCFFADRQFYGCYCSTKLCASGTPVPCGLFWANSWPLLALGVALKTFIKAILSLYANPDKKKLLLCLNLEETVRIYVCHTCTLLVLLIIVRIWRNLNCQ